MAIAACGHHAEVYESIDEFLAGGPKDGLVLARDDPDTGGIQSTMVALVTAGFDLPLVATAREPQVCRVVAAIKAGAFDYLSLPFADPCLAGVLDRAARAGQTDALAVRRRIEAQDRISRLSRREREVLNCIVAGGTNRSIAEELAISARTVEIYRANMMKKLGAKTVADAIRMTFQCEEGSFA